MANYTAADIKNLREETGAGMLDCKKALDESNGDMSAAREWIKARGMAKAAKTADRETKEGYIGSYVHATGKTAALVEVLCETDFVARNDEFRTLVRDIAMHVVAMNPADVAELLEQEFVKDPSQTIEQLLKALSGKIGENMTIARFVRYQVGE